MQLARLPAVVFLALQLLMPTAAGAQQPVPQAPVSLHDVVRIALQNQNDIILGRNEVTIARQRVVQARSSYYPQISIDNNTFRIGGRGVLNQSRTGTALTATQNIFDGGLREADVAAARHNLEGTGYGLTRTVQSVVFDVTQAYYEVLRSKHLADVASSTVRYNEELRQIIQARVDLGDAAQSDVLPVEAELANAKVNLLQNQNAVKTASIQLQNSMGLAPQPGFDVQDVAAEPSVQIQPLEAYMSVAMANRPDIGQTQASVGAATASVRSARIELYPRPVITGQYEKGIGGLSGTSSQIVGGFSFDLFNGNANRAAYKVAQAAKAEAEQRNSQVIKDIQAQVRTAHLNLTNASERLNASKIGLQSAQTNYDVQNERYKQGLAVPLDLLNAEVQVVTAQTNLVQARYDYYVAVAQMDFAVGRQEGTNAS